MVSCLVVQRLWHEKCSPLASFGSTCNDSRTININLVPYRMVFSNGAHCLMVLIPTLASSGKKTNIWSVGSSLCATRMERSVRFGRRSLRKERQLKMYSRHYCEILTSVYPQTDPWTGPTSDPTRPVSRGSHGPCTSASPSCGYAKVCTSLLHRPFCFRWQTDDL